MAVGDIGDYVTKSVLRLKESLTGRSDADFARAKALAKHIGRLVLTPTSREGRLMYEVTGSVSVQGESESVECCGWPGRNRTAAVSLFSRATVPLTST